ncbi:MAG: hypothetical protein AAB599_00590 [Patescibacteria group bacterium]
MNNKPQRGNIGIILLFAIALIAVGTGAYFYGKGGFSLKQTPPAPGAQVSTTPTQASDQATEWKTYTN